VGVPQQTIERIGVHRARCKELEVDCRSPDNTESNADAQRAVQPENAYFSDASSSVWVKAQVFRTTWDDLKKTSPLWSRGRVCEVHRPGQTADEVGSDEMRVGRRTVGLPAGRQKDRDPRQPKDQNTALRQSLSFGAVCRGRILNASIMPHATPKPCRSSRRDQSGCLHPGARAIHSRQGEHGNTPASSSYRDNLTWFAAARLPGMKRRKTSGNTCAKTYLSNSRVRNLHRIRRPQKRMAQILNELGASSHCSRDWGLIG